jgi:carboxylesterase
VGMLCGVRSRVINSCASITGFGFAMFDQLPQASAGKTDHSLFSSGGPTGVLLLHGLGGTPNEMRGVADAVARAGHTVSVPQLVGHCGTYADLKKSRWQDWLASAERALMELRRTCGTVVVGGLSTGAVLSLHLAANHPAMVQGTVMLAPTLWLNGWMIPKYACLFRLIWMKSFANLLWFTDEHPHGIKDEAIRARVRAAMLSGDSSQAGLPVTPGGALLEHRWLVQAIRKRLGEVRQPTLIIHPREDD